MKFNTSNNEHKQELRARCSLNLNEVHRTEFAAWFCVKVFNILIS